MLQETLKNYNIILASGSPRRHQFFRELGIDFEIRLKNVEEIYPERLRGSDIPDYLAQLKALPFREELQEKDILITSDTIVWHREKALGKPKNREEAVEMIKTLSNDSHEVITSICFTTPHLQKTVNATTKVFFNSLTNGEITHYIDRFKPFDKAGAYGIQEWIGLVGIRKIEGSYFNVVGLPVHLMYNTLKGLIEENT
ncbi:Maf-like protein [Sinomicrobium weinanense]|uniref:dTTP/UTP pyrophosphatase n=1 Tax=Sinomicrobium weinanense TaxID=2842200 RepID=A0A926JTF1_9FLAO|nr:Maf-like protein [Sinomicrobium weinanense]MBC9796979.1 septum formation protein Maf [Sinomicrobium weinanense]MBU3122182.1 septum formation protein Maf [Sinomicrobium weinanense]